MVGAHGQTHGWVQCSQPRRNTSTDDAYTQLDTWSSGTLFTNKAKVDPRTARSAAVGAPLEDLALLRRKSRAEIRT